MLFFKRIKIRSYEVGLYFRDRDFKGLLGEGRHWLFDPLCKVQVEVVSLRDPWLVQEKLDVIVKLGALKDRAVVLDLKDHERAARRARSAAARPVGGKIDGRRREPGRPGAAPSDYPPAPRHPRPHPAALKPRSPALVHRALAALVALVVAVCVAHAEPVRTPNVEAELVSERTALVPGQTATVALRLKIRDHWHTYWQNPGDSGLPTTLDWKLPGGIVAGPIQWPAPKALPAGPLVNFGYEGEVFHLVDLTVPATLPVGSPVTLAARADWLVCEDTCIPEGADLTLTLRLPRSPTPTRSGACRFVRPATRCRGRSRAGR